MGYFDNKEMVKAGLPVGTISGNYKKISDNPAMWKYLTEEEILKNESGNDRRAYLANKAQLITNVQELACTEKNYKSIGTAYLSEMRNEVNTRDVICKANNRKVVDVNTTHIFKDKNTDFNKTLRVRALPFVFPIIEKYGKKGLVTRKIDGVYTEIVGKADITVKGEKKRCAIAVVLVTNKAKVQYLTQLSVFVVNNKVIKSLTTDAPRMNRLVRSGLKKPCASDSHFSVHNLIIAKSQNESTEFINSPIHICMTHITEGNREAKFDQLEKCLNGEKPVFIPADDTKPLYNIDLRLKDRTPERIEKALRTMSMSLDIPLKAAKGEIFFYKAQEELTDEWCKYFSGFVRDTYDFVTDYFDLPKKTVMEKSVLRHKGKVLYNPESGEPIKQKEWDLFVKNLEKFLNRNKKPGEKIILQAQSLAKILNRMLKYNTLKAVKKAELNKLEYGGKKFDWISDSVKNMKNVFGESLTRQDMARIEIMSQSAAEKISNIDEKIRSDIKQTLIDGVKGYKSKGQVSQALFDRMVGDNRDFQRLADTEIQNAFNNAFIREEVYNAPEGEKVYFQRIEVIDSNTCQRCKDLNGKIALWSNKPQATEKAGDGIADYVIWEGKEWTGKNDKVCTGVLHPYCRGSWVRYDRGTSFLDAIVAEKSGKAEKWNNAVKQAKKEFEAKGIENPDDSTKGFTERIQELYNSEDIKKSNPFRDSLGRFTFGIFSPNTDTCGGDSQNTSEVKYKDGYVLTKNGSKDFGEITKDFAKEIKRQAGKIRLQKGWHDELTDEGFGEAHIERPKRMKQLNQVGFNNARDFIENICNGYDAIYSSGKSLMFVKTKDLFTCIAELTPNKEADFYDVKTAYVSSKNNIKNKINKKKIRLVWNSPTSLDLSKSLTPYNSKSISSIPTGFIKETSDKPIIAKNYKKSNI